MAGFRVVRCCHLDLTWRLFGFAVVLFMCAKVEAADRAWRNPDGGTFSSASNWSGGVPGASDAAGFGLSTPGILGALPPYTVSFTADATNQSLRVLDDRVTFDLNGHVYTTSDASVAMQLGTVSGASGRLAVLDGIVILPFQSELQIASTSGGSGLLAVAAGGLVIGSPVLTVGLNGNGTLNIFDNGDLIADDTTIGANSGSTGAANITGSGSSLLAGALDVGSGGNGTLNISASGRVDSAFGVLGDLVGSTGVANVDGINSRWKLSSGLVIGRSGPGALNITGGGRVESSFGIVGRELFSTGTVNVDGPGSQWINSSSLVVGYLGLGTLNITGGGKVQSARSDVGLDNGSGEVTVGGAGSEWIVSGELNLGWEEPGTLDITAGGSVLVSDGLTIGSVGTGDLNIRTGGRVESSFGIVGDELSSTGTVNVDGPGSEWINSGSLDIGYLGLGTLNITGGGKVQSAHSRVGLDDPGSGEVTVDGAGSEWIVSGELIVGDEGPGTLDITAGGSVLVTDKLTIGKLNTGTLNSTGGGRIESSSGSVGRELFSTGTVNVDGPGSAWTDSGSLDIGYFGLGTLNITGGGKVQSTHVRLGLDDPGSGVVTVDGSGSEWIISGELKLGVEGFGTLDITAGGSVVSNTNAFIGSGPFSISTATVAGAAPNGAGSNWTIDGRLSIGGDAPAGTIGGTGTLKIQPGGSVSIGASQDIALFPDGLLRLEGGTLSTPQIDFQGSGTFDWTAGTLHVGLFGGTLTVPSGGILAPGNSAGRTDVHGDYRQHAGAILAMEIGGTAASIQYDTLFVAGNAVLGGNLQLSMLDGFIPSPVDTFFIFQASNPFGPTSVTGSFANLANGQRLTTSDGRGSFVVNYGPGSAFNPTQIVLSSFLATPLPGDYNQNGVVDAADYTLWRDHLGSVTSLPNDDTPGVGPDDYTRWRTNFGQTAGSGIGAIANNAVPEPAVLALVFVAMITSVNYRRTPPVRRRTVMECRQRGDSQGMSLKSCADGQLTLSVEFTSRDCAILV